MYTHVNYWCNAKVAIALCIKNIIAITINVRKLAIKKLFDRYNPGACAVRWAIPLAAIAALDAATLSALAFILASRHVRLQPEPFNNGSLYKGD